MMALDKQKILNELGSVVNQLQSADCGCMSRLFNGGNNPNHGYGRPGSHCGWGHSHCAQEPRITSCVARCNPPKLMAETYNYYDQHVVKPTMEEVYNDLKSITPDNTVANHPLAYQMGAAQAGMTNILDTNNRAAFMPQQGQSKGRMQDQQYNGGMEHQGHIMGGQQGHGQVMNGFQDMHNVEVSGRATSGVMQGQGLGQSMGSMPTGLGHVTGEMRNNQEQHMMMAGHEHAMGQILPGQGQVMHRMSVQNSGQPMAGMTAVHGQAMGGMTAGHGQAMGGMTAGEGQAMGGMTAGQGQAMGGMTAGQGQAMGGMTTGQGQAMGGMLDTHNRAMGEMQGRNPSQAMEGMMGDQGQGMGAMMASQATGRMLGSQGHRRGEELVRQNQAMGGMPHIMQSQNTQQVAHMNAQPMPSQLMTRMSNSNPLGDHAAALQKFNEVFPEVMSGDHGINPMEMAIQLNPENNKKSALNAILRNQMQPSSQTPALNQQQMPAGSPQKLKMSPVMPAQQQLQPPKNMEPIIPADIETGFNTLGQPVEILPGNFYRNYHAGLPQAKNGGHGYGNVKSTISKTSLIGNKGSYRTPSRSQLQHLYNQYKGSHSFTQQNIQDPKYGGTVSDGKLDMMRTNQRQHIPLERMGGDSAMNNRINQQMKGDEESILQSNKTEQVGDTPNNQLKQVNHEIKSNLQQPPVQSKQCRNGLQDVVYTNYSLGASWSFHGTAPPRNVFKPSLKY